MSEGKKFVKTDSNLTPEQRLDEIERKYGVIQERIQSYDQVLVEFANINSDLNSIKQSLEINGQSNKEWYNLFKERMDILNSKILAISKNNETLFTNFNDQSNLIEEITKNFNESYGKFYRDTELLKMHLGNVDTEHNLTRSHIYVNDERLHNLDKLFTSVSEKLNSLSIDHTSLKSKFDVSCEEQKNKTDTLMSSIQDMPQFNEWATKIYIKVCNEINEKQKAFYQELDKRSQQLKEQLASDPYTADSVKKILKEEMDALSMDGKNAYIKATNAAQQIQLLEKKLENINLILKKYELSK